MTNVVNITRAIEAPNGRLASFRPDYRAKREGRAVLALIDMRKAGEDQTFSASDIAPMVRR